MTTHRRWSAEEKFTIVMDGLQPDSNVAEICRRHGISSTVFYAWKQKGLENLKVGLRPREGGEGSVEGVRGRDRGSPHSANPGGPQGPRLILPK